MTDHIPDDPELTLCECGHSVWQHNSDCCGKCDCSVSEDGVELASCRKRLEKAEKLVELTLEVLAWMQTIQGSMAVSDGIVSSETPLARLLVALSANGPSVETVDLGSVEIGPEHDLDQIALITGCGYGCPECGASMVDCGTCGLEFKLPGTLAS